MSDLCIFHKLEIWRFQKYQRKPAKVQKSWRIEFQPRKGSKIWKKLKVQKWLFRAGNQLKTQKTSPRGLKWGKFSKKKYRKKVILGPKIWEKLKVQKWLQNSSSCPSFIVMSVSFLFFSKRMNFPAGEAFFSPRPPVITLHQPRGQACVAFLIT